MNCFLGQTETDIGTVNFSMNGEKFELQTPKRVFTVYEDDIKEADGKFFFPLPRGSFSGMGNTTEIEIPAYILERKAEVLKELEASKNSVGSTETPQGKIYFFLELDGIRAKLGEKEEITDTFYTVEGKRVLFLPGLGLDIPFVVIPEGVEKAFMRAKLDREQQRKYLVYAGRSLLDGRDYYRLSCDLTNDTFNRVKNQMEYFEPGDFGKLEGWLTSAPELVEDYLRIRNPIASRKDEIEKQMQQAIKENEKVIKKLMAC